MITCFGAVVTVTDDDTFLTVALVVALTYFAVAVAFFEAEVWVGQIVTFGTLIDDA